MLEKDVEKRFDLTELIPDNLIVHLPRVEGARQPALWVRLLLFYGPILLSNLF